MRRIEAYGILALLFVVSTTGCKSMPSLTWWKTASKTEAADSTALAHGAPQLPSEVALEAERANAAQVAAASSITVTAPPYVSTGAPSINPSVYPSTSAPAFKASTTTEQVAATTAPPAKNPNLGSIALPYNPDAVPPPAPSTTTLAQASAPTDRYGSTTAAAPQPPTSFGAPSNPAIPAGGSSFSSSSTSAGLGDRYASASVSPGTSDFDPVSASPSTPAAPSPTTPSNFSSQAAPAFAAVPAGGSSQLGDRYSQAASSSYEPAAATPPSPSQAPAAASATMSNQSVATTGPYRPGGTSSYPGAQAAQPAYNVAARPEEMPEGHPATEQVPNVATPDSSVPGTQRYW